MTRPLIFLAFAMACAAASAQPQAQNPFAKPSAVPATPVAGAVPALPVVEEPEVPKEEVPAERLGRVGGEYLYRGTLKHTYLYTPAQPAVVRVPADPLAASKTGEPAVVEKPPQLPSMVGGKSPAEADARDKNAARPAAGAKPAATPTKK